MKHDWECMGGAGGWEVWDCRHCRTSRIPWPLLGLWRPFDRCKPPAQRQKHRRPLVAHHPV